MIGTFRKNKYYININNSSDNDQYLWIYIGLKENKNTITVTEEITGTGINPKYLITGGYDLPKSELKEISKYKYEILKNAIYNTDDYEYLENLLLKAII